LTFATCTYTEYDPATMGGLPVRTTVGNVRFKLRYPLEHKMPAIYPARTILKLPQPDFTIAYLAALTTYGVDGIRRDAAAIRAAAGVDESTRLVALCFDRLGVPGKPAWCHRTLFARWWTEQTGEEVPEYGAVLTPEIRADQHDLF